MMAGLDLLAYRCAPAIAWVKDVDRTLLVDEGEGRCWSLTGLEAVIWDLLALGYSFERSAELLAVMRDEPLDEARRMVATTVRTWGEVGILQAVGEGECG